MIDALLHLRFFLEKTVHRKLNSAVSAVSCIIPNNRRKLNKYWGRVVLIPRRSKMVSTRQSSNMGSASSSRRVSEPVEAGQSRKHHNQVPAGSAGSGHTSPEPAPVQHVTLLNLPPELLDKIISSFDLNTVAQLRLVCRQFNMVCGFRLNTTFQRLQSQMLSRFQSIKAQMPRRESARRNHPLACEYDIIETLHMRLTLLQMSFGKHIERKHCCFFPGEILDEVYRILHYIKTTPKLTKPYKVTDELFDLTTMAMEYFKERIEHTLPEISYFGPDFLDLAGTFSSSSSVSKPFVCLDSTPMSGDSNKDSGSGGECSPSHRPEDPSLIGNNIPPPQSNMFLRKRIRKIKQGMKRYNNQLSMVRRDLRNCKVKIADQQKQIVEYANRLDDHDKKNEETSRKFSTLLQELNKCKTELQYWRSKSPAISVCNGCGQSMPMPAEDFHALANQGVLSDSFTDALNFIPIAGTDNSMEPSNHQPQTSTEMAPPRTPLSSLSSKRKLSSDEPPSGDIIKKPRRVVKSRQAKRSKI